MWFSSKVHKGRRKEKRITPCRQGRPGPCRRPAQRPGGLWSWTCRRPAGCPAVRAWLPVDPRRDPDRLGHVHLHLHLGRRNRHDHAVRRGLWWWRGEWNHEFKNKKATESGEKNKQTDFHLSYLLQFLLVAHRGTRLLPCHQPRHRGCGRLYASPADQQLRGLAWEPPWRSASLCNPKTSLYQWSLNFYWNESLLPALLQGKIWLILVKS